MFKTLTTEQFIQKASKIHNNRYRYWNSIYVNSHTKLIITCLEHGDFLQTPNSHLNGNGCPGCKAKATSVRCRQTTDWFIQKATIVHGGRYNYDNVDYQGDLVKVNIICKIHGVFKQTPNRHLSGAGCSRCKYEKIANMLKNDKAEFVKKLYRCSW